MGAPRRVLPKPLQQPHPPIFGATSSLPGHEEIGQRGIGLCSFTVGLPPEQLAENIGMYRKGLAACTQPAGKFVNDTAATFTMVLCAPSNEEATEVARESFEWYPKYGGGLIASVAEWQEERGITGEALGTYQYTGETLKHKREGAMGQLTIDYLRDSGSAVMGDPDACIAAAKRYEAVGCDLLLCLVNPYKIPHEKVMQTIELMGKHVLPEFK
jgi:alkanesulfonate monooxygenase SsuD/methylene tetrahydromethanopterin reductase-like flavin-dependent oxidoreductase (luciferase family)